MPTLPKLEADKIGGKYKFSPLENLAVAKAALEVSERGETAAADLEVATGQCYGRQLQLLCS